jgi:hypothetical protein
VNKNRLGVNPLVLGDTLYELVIGRIKEDRVIMEIHPYYSMK